MRKNIGKTITEGTAYQRALLLAEIRAHHRTTRELLVSASELRQLEDSFRKPKEIEIYQRFKRLEDLLPLAINVLQGARLDVGVKAERLRGLILYWTAVEEAEELANLLLWRAAKDPEGRLAILGETLGNYELSTELAFVKPRVDKEAFVWLDVRGGRDAIAFNLEGQGKSGPNAPQRVEGKPQKWRGLLEVLEEARQSLIVSAMRFMSYTRAVLDVMDEQRFNVKLYRESVESGPKALRELLKLYGRYSASGGVEDWEIFASSRAQDLNRRLYDYSVDIDSLGLVEEDYHAFRINHLIPAKGYDQT